MKFQIYSDKTRGYCWRLLASNGQLVATSDEGYMHREDVRHAIIALQASIPVATIVHTE